MSALWRFLTSARLTVVLSVLIALDVTAGSVLMSAYREQFERLEIEPLFAWMLDQGLREPGLSAWLFVLLALLALLALNTLACTVEAARGLRRLGPQARTSRRRRLLSQALHLGFVIGLVGHLVSTTSGYRSTQNRLFEGARLTLPGDPRWSVRLNRMDVAFSAEGQMERMDAYLSLLRGEETVRDEVVRLNEPLLSGATAVYVVHHGRAPRAIRLRATSTEGDETIALGLTEAGAEARFGEYRIVAGRFVPDFAMDASARVYSASGALRNPAVELQVYRRDALRSRGWVFLNFPDWMALSFDGYRLVFSGLDYASYAVLAVNRDPGAIIVLGGAALFLLALLGVLFSKGEDAELAPAPPRRAKPDGPALPRVES